MIRLDVCNGWKADVPATTLSVMPFSLLEVGEHLSLEFEVCDLDAVRLHIKERFSDVSSRAAGIATIVKFGGEEFTFQNEWDDPCLISRSHKGDELLRSIHAHFA